MRTITAFITACHVMSACTERLAGCRPHDAPMSWQNGFKKRRAARGKAPPARAGKRAGARPANRTAASMRDFCRILGDVMGGMSVWVVDAAGFGTLPSMIVRAKQCRRARCRR